MNPTALEVHRDALIVDGLVFMGDGSTENLPRALDLARAPP